MVSILVITVAPFRWRHNARRTTSEWLVRSGKNMLTHVPVRSFNLTATQPDLSTVVLENRGQDGTFTFFFRKVLLRIKNNLILLRIVCWFARPTTFTRR